MPGTLARFPMTRAGLPSQGSQVFAISTRVPMIKFVAFTLFLILSSELRAGALEVVVRDLEGDGVEDVVVFADALGKEKSPPSSQAGTKKSALATIAQRNKEFEPYVTPMRVGTAVNFPNEDDILHNVYSFSKAKKFQLPLYKDSPPDPVIFDKRGPVILGCNIHDWMVAYVYVLETPFFSKTDSTGRATLAAIPEGDYEVQVWHPRRKKRGSSPPQRTHLEQDEVKQAEFVVALKPEWRPRRALD